MLEQLKILCALDGVSSFEEDVRAYLLTQVKPFADEIRVDAMGNLLVHKKGAKQGKKKLLLAAHMDEVGMIVRFITEEGLLKFAFIGGVDRRVVLGKRVFVGPDHIPGVIGLKPYHLLGKEEGERIPKADELYIDIGAKDRNEAEKKVALGEYVVFAADQQMLGSDYFCAKAIDDRVGCAVLLRLIQEPLPVDCTFAFTVQEEVGTRGAFGAAFSVKPDIALVVEGTTVADLPSVPEQKQVCAVGNGVVIPFMDGGTIYDRELYQILTRLAEEKKIPWQTKTYIAGGTDARTIQRSGAGVRTAGIAAAVRYLHAPSSVFAVRDLDAMYRLAREFLEEMSRQDC
ncbi:MAG: M42 family peptidase [Oscillospiraceae bacterium]|nr:M42 family peptidase [Oscillospiraceae bacterium]